MGSGRRMRAGELASSRAELIPLLGDLQFSRQSGGGHSQASGQRSVEAEHRPFNAAGWLGVCPDYVCDAPLPKDRDPVDVVPSVAFCASPTSLETEPVAFNRKARGDKKGDQPVQTAKPEPKDAGPACQVLGRCRVACRASSVDENPSHADEGEAAQNSEGCFPPRRSAEVHRSMICSVTHLVLASLGHRTTVVLEMLRVCSGRTLSLIILGPWT